MISQCQQSLRRQCPLNNPKNPSTFYSSNLKISFIFYFFATNYCSIISVGSLRGSSFFSSSLIPSHTTVPLTSHCPESI